ncbi:MAG TPA: WecB/TagA/CpsF family glycosyltransferase [Verrucomicrobiae bacterium]|nr:WecB/TagA/CpsF family glycosyltransferase [Verrucomicrobiae bacterium]
MATARPEREGAGATAPPAAIVLGLPVSRCDRAQALRLCEEVVAQRRRSPARPLHVVTLNPEILMQARRLPDLRAVVRRAGLVLADGQGIVWAARRLGLPALDRVAGVDLLEDLAQLAAQRGWRLFLLGAAPGVAWAAASRLQARHPALVVAGTAAGSAAAADGPALAREIAGTRADILAVAFGAPRQELWLDRQLVATGCSVGIGVGGSLDVLAGRVPRAPAWLRGRGLEWAWRLLRQPRRLPRMLRASPFFWLVWRERPR